MNAGIGWLADCCCCWPPAVLLVYSAAGSVVIARKQYGTTCFRTFCCRTHFNSLHILCSEMGACERCLCFPCKCIADICTVLCDVFKMVRFSMQCNLQSFLFFVLSFFRWLSACFLCLLGHTRLNTRCSAARAAFAVAVLKSRKMADGRCLNAT